MSLDIDIDLNIEYVHIYKEFSLSDPPPQPLLFTLLKYSSSSNLNTASRNTTCGVLAIRTQSTSSTHKTLHERSGHSICACGTGMRVIVWIIRIDGRSTKRLVNIRNVCTVVDKGGQRAKRSDDGFSISGEAWGGVGPGASFP